MVFVYDAAGQLVAEYANTANPDNGVRYLAVDQLGSTRLVTDVNGNAVQRMDYFPFGEEIAGGQFGRTATPYTSAVYPTSASGGVGQKFTSKERDAETGLDYFGARYMLSAQGRFTSPDAPFADQHAADPQSWNMYAYIRNNPLKSIDPNGAACFDGNGGCGDYILGGIGAVGNAFSSNLINLPNRLLDAAISPFTSFRFGDVARDAFTPVNTDQRLGMEAANIMMLVSPLAEAGATGIVNAIGTGARVEAGAAVAQETGTVYKLPAQESSGKPYIGRTTKSVEERMATRTDGRTGPAEPVDTFNAQERAHGQKAINANGGVKNLDNKRNEVNTKRYEELKKSMKVSRSLLVSDGAINVFWQWFSCHHNDIEAMLDQNNTDDLTSRLMPRSTPSPRNSHGRSALAW